jgi:hypothetical protein
MLVTWKLENGKSIDSIRHESEIYKLYTAEEEKDAFAANEIRMERKPIISILKSASKPTLQDIHNENKEGFSSVRCFPLKNRILPQNFRLSQNTVVLGKGKGPKEASGNLRLRELVKEHLEEYADSGRQGKMAVISKIIQNIQNENQRNGRGTPSFVRFHGGHWWEASEKECRTKVTASFRDLLADCYRSSSKSKVEHRRQQRQQKKSVTEFQIAVQALNRMKN